MDDPLGVGVGQRLADLLEDLEEARQVFRGAFALRSSASSVRPSTSFMAKNGRSSASRPTSCTGATPGCCSRPPIARLFHEATHQFRPAAVLFQKHLDGEVASEVRIVSPEDGAHAAARDLTQETATAGGCGDRFH